MVKNTHLLSDGMLGRNYWFNGSMAYLMECLGKTAILTTSLLKRIKKYR